MKKFFLIAAILGGTSLASMAGTAKHATVKARKPNYLIHFAACGVDTYAYGATAAEARETVKALANAYC